MQYMILGTQTPIKVCNKKLHLTEILPESYNTNYTNKHFTMQLRVAIWKKKN